MEQTLAIIKPDAVRDRQVGQIISEIEKRKLRIATIKTLQMTEDEVGRFYEIHRGKSFFQELIDFMSSGQIFVLVLERENAIEEWRRLIGQTDPARAEAGTIRRRFGTSLMQNTVHGADSISSAEREIDFFFGEKTCAISRSGPK